VAVALAAVYDKAFPPSLRVPIRSWLVLGALAGRRGIMLGRRVAGRHSTVCLLLAVDSEAPSTWHRTAETEVLVVVVAVLMARGQVAQEFPVRETPVATLLSGAAGNGGGGGGAGAAGGNGISGFGGNGGVGIESSFNGTATYYAGGGGGGAWITFSPPQTSGTGGLGGGGNAGATSNARGTDGTNGLGGGGGGGSDFTPGGGNGGNGIVILRYRL
jgi:hypothetical protein